MASFREGVYQCSPLEVACDQLSIKELRTWLICLFTFLSYRQFPPSTKLEKLGAVFFFLIEGKAIFLERRTTAER